MRVHACRKCQVWTRRADPGADLKGKRRGLAPALRMNLKPRIAWGAKIRPWRPHSGRPASLRRPRRVLCIVFMPGALVCTDGMSLELNQETPATPQNPGRTAACMKPGAVQPDWIGRSPVNRRDVHLIRASRSARLSERRDQQARGLSPDRVPRSNCRKGPGWRLWRRGQARGAAVLKHGVDAG
jgi:hypothetical protein